MAAFLEVNSRDYKAGPILVNAAEIRLVETTVSDRGGTYTVLHLREGLPKSIRITETYEDVKRMIPAAAKYGLAPVSLDQLQGKVDS